MRQVNELAYSEFISEEIFNNEFFGDVAREKLIYYPTVTREEFTNMGRLTDALESGKLAEDVGLPPVNTDDDRFMLCGSPSMLKDFTDLLDKKGFHENVVGDQGCWVVERAFVER